MSEDKHYVEDTKTGQLFDIEEEKKEVHNEAIEKCIEIVNQEWRSGQTYRQILNSIFFKIKSLKK